MKSATNPGWKTSELWVLIASGFVSAAATYGWISQAQANNLTMQAPAIIADAGTALAGVVYILSRSALKWRWLQLAAADMATPQPDPSTPLPDSPPSPSYGATPPSANGNSSTATPANITSASAV